MSVELLVGFASTIAAIAASAATLGYWLGRKLEEVEKRLEEHGKRLGEVDRKIERLEGRVAELVRAVHAHLVDFMSLKGLFTAEERSYLLRGVERIITAYAPRGDPLDREEAEFLLEVVRELREKPAREVDLAKLDKALEIADQWFKRDGIYEAMKLWMILYTLRAILLKERGEL